MVTLNGILAGIWYLYFNCKIVVDAKSINSLPLWHCCGLILSVIAMVTCGFPETALLSAYKDPDEAMKYIDSEWKDLKSVATQNMRIDENLPLGEKPKAPKAKKVKKETTNSKLAEIEKNGKIATLEIQIEALEEIIESKSQRLTSITEDESMSELMDKKKVKILQKEIKVLEGRKSKMEKMYEKMCGKKYRQQEIVGETKNEE